MNPIDLRDLIDHPGASRTVHVVESVEGLRLELAAVAEDVPIRADLLLESVVEGILVSGTVSGRAALACARCLKSFDDGFDVRVRELFSRGASPGDDEYPLSPSGEIDIEPMVRDAILLSMPFSPLCRPDERRK